MPAWLLLSLILIDPPSTEAIDVGEVRTASALVAAYECNRCHTIENVEPPSIDKQCVGCHVEIKENRYDAPARALRQWKRNIRHLVDVPSLVGTQERFRRAWIAEYLMKPHSQRPLLGESMPRLNLSTSEARRIASHFGAADEDGKEFTGGELEAGRNLLDTRGCGSCHSFSGVSPLKSSAPSARLKAAIRAKATRLAPDLRWTRDRFRPERLEAWLLNPKSLKKDTLMPNEGLTAEEARHIAAYILRAPLKADKARPVPQRLTLLKRRVRYEEIEKKILHKTCWHCHSEPDYARGDGGPGNTGGFGFAARGINLSDYAGVASGHIDRAGKRRSLFSKSSYRDMPLLVAALWARHAEVSGSPVPGIRGMPLGLPPLSPKEIQLIESWVAQGRPQ